MFRGRRSDKIDCTEALGCSDAQPKRNAKRRMKNSAKGVVAVQVRAGECCMLNCSEEANNANQRRFRTRPLLLRRSLADVYRCSSSLNAYTETSIGTLALSPSVALSLALTLLIGHRFIMMTIDLNEYFPSLIHIHSSFFSAHFLQLHYYHFRFTAHSLRRMSAERLVRIRFRCGNHDFVFWVPIGMCV